MFTRLSVMTLAEKVKAWDYIYQWMSFTSTCSNVLQTSRPSSRNSGRWRGPCVRHALILETIYKIFLKRRAFWDGSTLKKSKGSWDEKGSW